MSLQSQSPHGLLRPAQPLAVGVMLAQMSLGALALTLAGLLAPHLVTFDLVLMGISGIALIALGVREGERDRIVWEPDNEPTLWSKVSIWVALVAFAGAPVVLAALLIDRFLPTTVVAFLALGANLAGWSIVFIGRLRFDSVWLPRPKDDEMEGGLALGAVLLAVTLSAGWLLVRIDEAFGNGAVPSTLGPEAGILLSVIGTAMAGTMALVSLAVRRMAHEHSAAVSYVAFGTLLVPLLFLLALPLYRWGDPSPAFVPTYASAMTGKVFLAAVFAFGVVEVLRSRRDF